MASVRQIMTHDVVSVTPDLSLRSALELLATRHIGGAPVMAGSRLIGVITMSDILSFQSSMPVVPALEPEPVEAEWEPAGEWREGEEAPAAFFTDMWSDVGADVAERFEEVRSAEWDPLAEHTVAEAMSRHVVAVGPDTPVKAAARLMSRLQIHRLLVLDRGKLCGMVTAMDVVRALGEARV